MEKDYRSAWLNLPERTIAPDLIDDCYNLQIAISYYKVKMEKCETVKPL
jgi:hypothetical protein